MKNPISAPLDDVLTAANAKNRVSLREATVKCSHVKQTLRMIGRAAGNLKKGRASAPIDLSAHL